MPYPMMGDDALRLGKLGERQRSMDVAPALMSAPAAAPGGCPACGAEASRAEAGHKLACAGCGTHWMPGRRSFVYDDAYPAQRSHFDAAVARCKQATLARWVRRTGVPVAGSRVLEVGFGGGATLHWLQEQGAEVAGQEPVAANRDAAARGGIPACNLAADLQDFAGQRFDLVLYLDAFEHLTDPASHLRQLNELTAPGAQAMVVLPVAGSLSQRLMGKAWPHDIADHWVFYSTRGLAALWGRFGWTVARQFYPWKNLSALTVAGHVKHKTGLSLPLGPLAGAALWLNFGERGLLFERTRAP